MAEKSPPTHVLGETKLAAHAVTSHCVRTSSNKPVHINTVRRWITRGVKGTRGTRVKLEAVRQGGMWVTSVEALERFAAALTGQPTTSLDRAPVSHPESSGRVTAADQKLRSLGI